MDTILTCLPPIDPDRIAPGRHRSIASVRPADARLLVRQEAADPTDGPQVLLCTEGSATVYAKQSAVLLERGAAAWIAADDGPIRLDAQQPTRLFRVTVGI